MTTKNEVDVSASFDAQSNYHPVDCKSDRCGDEIDGDRGRFR
jgi:hypothetical protein